MIFEARSIEQVYRGGNMSATVVKCDTNPYPHLGIKSIYCVVDDDGFAVYDEEPFRDNESDEWFRDHTVFYRLHDDACNWDDDRGYVFDYGEYDKVANAVLDLYRGLTGLNVFDMRVSL